MKISKRYTVEWILNWISPDFKCPDEVNCRKRDKESTMKRYLAELPIEGDSAFLLM
jgi:hypothetical protein